MVTLYGFIVKGDNLYYAQYISVGNVFMLLHISVRS